MPFTASTLLALESPLEGRLSVLSYNVHGLPPVIARDNPRDRVMAIGSLAATYDVVLFQEAFEYRGLMRRQMEGSVAVNGNGMASDPRHLAAKILLAPASLLFSHFAPPYGAGLATFVKEAFALPGDVGRQPFRVCDGWLGARFDCWASKGYLRVGIRTAEGLEVDVYSTHLDAGRGARSDRIRRHQLAILASAIEAQSADRAVIVGGDFNLAFDRPGDAAVMIEFRDRLRLRDSGAGPTLPSRRNYDYILYRSGARAPISVEDAGEAREFGDGRQALSDHPALYARFRLRSTPEQAGEQDPVESRPGAPSSRRDATVLQ